MATSRPATPNVLSDTSSDPGSLSDLESGWTDLSSNRSGGRHSPSGSTSDVGDDGGASSAIDRYEGETWEGLTPEGNETDLFTIDEHTLVVEPTPAAAHPVHSPVPQQATSDLTLEDWVADAVGSSFISEDGNMDTSTPHMSIRGSHAALRLAFPDPLSNSEDNLLPSHARSRTQSQSTEAISEPDVDCVPRTQTFSSQATPSFTGTLSSNPSLSLSDNRAIENENEKPDEVFELPSMEFIPSSPVSYALSIVLLGHPPLPHLKSKVVSASLNMVASALNGFPRTPKGSHLTRIYEVPIYMHEAETHSAQPDMPPIHRILISDCTSGSASSSSLAAFDCPTLAFVFIQPPLSSPNLPLLPLNTRYLPLLLPSVSDGFAASLLDLSPSVLFDNSVSNISTSDYDSRKAFAMQECIEMDILGKRLDGTQDILSVDEFTALPVETMSVSFRQLIFSVEKTSKDQAPEKEAALDGPQNNVLVFRKQTMIISTLLVALIFGSTVFLRGTPPITSTPAQSTVSPLDQKVWPILRPFVNRASTSLPSPSPSPISTETTPPSRALVPASLKSLAVSVFRTDTTPNNVPGPSKAPHIRTDNGKEDVNLRPAPITPGAENPPPVRPASIDPVARPLTLDAPSSKSLSVLSSYHASMSYKGKGKEKAADTSSDAPTPLPSSLNALGTHISNALSPLFDGAKRDLRELHEAIDALLHAVLRLQGMASRGIGDIVQVISKQAGESVQGIASKVYGVAQSVGERASGRHERARHNARKVRDAGERYVSVARQKIEKGFELAKENAMGVLDEGLAMGRNIKVKKEGRKQSRRSKRKNNDGESDEQGDKKGQGRKKDQKKKKEQGKKKDQGKKKEPRWKRERSRKKEQSKRTEQRKARRKEDRAIRSGGCGETKTRCLFENVMAFVA